MPAQKGSDMLLKMDTAVSGGPTFTTVAGIRSSQFGLSTGTTDVTNQGSTGKWQEMLAGAGIKKASLSGRGVFQGAAAEAAVRNSLLNGTIKQWQVVVPGDGTYQGLFQVTQLDRSGGHDKEVEYDFRLESAGELTFTAA